MDGIFHTEKENSTSAALNTNRKYIKLSILLLVIASSVYFFKIFFLNDHLIYILQFATIGLLVCIIIFQYTYWKFPLGKHHFTLPIVFIFIGVLLSMLTARFGHGQPFVISMWAQRFLYFYLLYFVLHILQVPIKTLEKIIFYSGVIYALVFFIQYAAFPRVIFDVRQGVERGTIRIFVPGLTIMNLAYFIGLVRVIYHNSFKYIPYLLIFVTIYLLSGTRSYIAGPTLITLLALIFSNRIKSKGFILLLVIGALGITFYMFQDIIENLVSLTSKQSKNFTEDHRYRAAEFFLTDFFPNQLAYITGNGEGHQISAFGREIFSYKANYGFYQSDIGLIGEYTKYGAFFILGVIILFYKVMSQKLSINLKYIHFFFLLLIISMILGSFFTSPDSIVILCMLMYMLDVERNTNPKYQKKYKPVVYFPEMEYPNKIPS